MNDFALVPNLISPVEGQSAKIAVQTSAGVCIQCGAEFFFKKHPFRLRVYEKSLCSERCRGLFYYRKRHPIVNEKDCKYCGERFVPKTTRSLFCCDACTRRWYTNKDCAVCGKPIPPKPGRVPGPRKTKFCSIICKKKNKAMLEERRRPGRNAHVRSAYLELKISVYSKLGNVCKCGENRMACLSIDHVFGNGAEDRRTTKGSFARLRKILSDNTGAYQILCMNCQWIKRVENKEHLSKEKAPPRLLAGAGRES